jgi:alcohol dehydrogenase
MGDLLKENGYQKPFIVCDKGTVAAGLVKRLTNVLDQGGVSYIVFDNVLPDPPIDIVDEGAAICRAEGCGAVIALGGGSSIDTGKAINILRFNEGSIRRFLKPDEQMVLSPGFIAVPTTAGTGSELSDGMILTDTQNNVKIPLLCTEGISEYAVIDPEMMATMPPELTAATGMDTLSHALEAFTSILATDFTDQITEQAIRTVLKWLPVACRAGRDMRARDKMAVAASLGGWMLACAKVHIGHSIAHVLGAKYHIPHGAACAYALPYAIEHIYDSLPPEKQNTIAELFCAEPDRADMPAAIREAIIRFVRSVGIEKPAMPDLGKCPLEQAAGEIEHELFQGTSPKKLNKEEALVILNDIFE